ncbi:hypothetical protein [Mesorhizobium sp. BR1-1-2]|uniref:hypothetical protein n=1 Tax=Mesorhizobium sp. BR1-1-2 TaxID=2876652 RepID=UPI001CCDF045|nr:hypothetical protein [Mesorhizobium sp. BR1-1-2]MBZ9966722.1 hypothetical protein [Mesorhizobium sp. BR1-1-2]
MIIAVCILLVAAGGALALWADRVRRVQQEADAATGGVGARAVPIMLANGCAGCHKPIDQLRDFVR